MKNANAAQLNLFDHVTQVYAEANGTISNDQLYQAVLVKAGIDPDDLQRKQPIGQAQELHSPLKRKIRWYQQTAKAMGLIERVEDMRGLWQITQEGKTRLRKAEPTVAMLAFSTDLGIALWGPNARVLRNFSEPIHLLLTSPPYPIQNARAYGGCVESKYVDFICHALEPIVANLVPGGSIVLNLGNECFLPGLPARSIYRERLVIALVDRFGLFKIDELIWRNGSKMPGPYPWTSKERFLLNPAYEPCYIFTNDPLRLISNNQRVLQPHTEQHLKLIAQGGEKRTAVYGDGAYTIRPGSFGKPTAGRIPRNVLDFGHACSDQQRYKRICKEMGIVANAAPMPLKLAKFLIQFLTEPGQLVVDIFGGSFTTAKAAEQLARLWLSCDQIWEFVRGGAERFRCAPGFFLNPLLERAIQC